MTAREPWPEDVPACPFCGHRRTTFEQITARSYVDQCDGCGARGPVGIGPDGVEARRRARIKWCARAAPAREHPPEHVERVEDMSPIGRLQLIVQEDGDVDVSVSEAGHDGLRGAWATVEFCAPGAGGGHSPATHAALLDLARAMADDERERPLSPPVGQVSQ